MSDEHLIDFHPHGGWRILHPDACLGGKVVSCDVARAVSAGRIHMPDLVAAQLGFRYVCHLTGGKLRVDFDQRRSVAPGELEVLGWPGILLRGVQVRNVRADMAAVVDRGLLARRRIQDPEPCLDPGVLSLWEDIPQLLPPPSPVTLAGAIFAMTEENLRTAALWSRFAPTAVRVDDGAAHDDLLGPAARRGIAVLRRVRDDGWRLAHPGRPRTGNRTPADRLVEETLYQRLIDDGWIDHLLADA